VGLHPAVIRARGLKPGLVRVWRSCATYPCARLDLNKSKAHCEATIARQLDVAGCFGRKGLVGPSRQANRQAPSDICKVPQFGGRCRRRNLGYWTLGLRSRVHKRRAHPRRGRKALAPRSHGLAEFRNHRDAADRVIFFVGRSMNRPVPRRHNCLRPERTGCFAVRACSEWPEVGLRSHHRNRVGNVSYGPCQA